MSVIYNAARERSKVKQQGNALSRRMYILLKVQKRRNKKWRKFEGIFGAKREKLEGKSDRFKFVNISDRQRRKRKILINETKSGVSVQAQVKMVPSQRNVF